MIQSDWSDRTKRKSARVNRRPDPVIGRSAEWCVGRGSVRGVVGPGGRRGAPASSAGGSGGADVARVDPGVRGGGGGVCGGRGRGR